VSGALRIAIVGAESTGKTALAQALAARLADKTALRVSWVPEWLRQWCDAHGRTPQAHEQAGIARAQHARIEAAAAAHDVVVCDTTALMTAVYSRFVFGDGALDDEAAALHRGMSLTLLTALDLPWEPDGLQRDGPQVRAPVDTLLRALMLARRLPWTVVVGQGPARLDAAMAAVQPLLAGAAPPRSRETARDVVITGSADRRGPGLFTRLTHAAPPAGAAWVCGCCAWPPGERAELAARTNPT
jgi:nicotinamide riboside kinase